MKRFLKISDNCIINIIKIITIDKIEYEINFETKYCIRYRIDNNYYRDQCFNSKEERDNFFRNVCSNLIY